MTYCNVIIVASSQLCFLAILAYYGFSNTATFWNTHPLEISLSQASVLCLRVTSLATAMILTLDFLVEFVISLDLFRRLRSRSSSTEFTIRFMFILSIAEPSLIMLSASDYQRKALIACATVHVRNILVFCASMSVLWNAAAKCPHRCFKFLLLSITFTFAQLMAFCITVSGDPATLTTQTLYIFAFFFTFAPILVYFRNAVQLTRILWLKVKLPCAEQQITNTEYLFLANFVGVVLITLAQTINLAISMKVHYYQNSATEIIAAEIPIIFMGLFATMIPSWIARVEAAKSQVSLKKIHNEPSMLICKLDCGHFTPNICTPFGHTS